jgi:hypothetical protein
MWTCVVLRITVPPPRKAQKKTRAQWRKKESEDVELEMGGGEEREQGKERARTEADETPTRSGEYGEPPGRAPIKKKQRVEPSGKRLGKPPEATIAWVASLGRHAGLWVDADATREDIKRCPPKVRVMEAETEMGRVAALMDVIDATGKDLRVPGLVKIWLQLSSSMARLLGAGEAERDER